MQGGLDLPRVPENCNVTILGEAPYLRMPSLNCFAAGQFGHSENTPRPVLMYVGSKVGWNAFPTMNEKYDFCCGASYFEKSQNPLGISGVKPFEGKKNKKKKPDAFLSQGKKVRDHVESLMGKAQEDLSALVMEEKRIDINDVKFIDLDQLTTQDIFAPGAFMSPSKKGYSIRYERLWFYVIKQAQKHAREC